MSAVIASDNPQTAEALREPLLRNFGDCQVVPLKQLDSYLKRSEVELAAICFSPDPERGLAAVQQVRSATGGRIVVIGPADDPKLILRTVREGADEYVDESEAVSNPTASLGHLKPAQHKAGRLIAVMAANGGTGCSTLAVNLSTSLASQHRQCALIDLKLEGGDLDALLKVQPAHTIADFCQNQERVDPTLFDRLLVRHESGVHLLAAPGPFSDLRGVNPEGIRRAVHMARTQFPYVVVDLDRPFRADQRELIAQADVILMVVRLDFTSLRSTRRVLEQFKRGGIPPERIHLVANRCGQSQEVPTGEALRALGTPVNHFVPDEPKSVNRATNHGVPVVLHRPRAKVSRSIRQLAAGLNGQG